MTSETGLYKVTIQAKRSDDALDDPLMELWINGEMQMKWIVSNRGEYAPYTWKGYWNTGSTIDVVYRHENGTFTDLSGLSVDCITVNNKTVQSESASAIFDRGEYSDGCFDGSDTIAGMETLTQTGALRFTVTGATVLTRLFEYDYNNMVTRIDENGTVSTYTYNPAGQRVKKVEDGTATYYFYANYEIEKTATTETQIVYYYVNGAQIAQRTITETSDELLYIHKDHLGSAVRLTNQAGDVVQQMAYEPYGNTVYGTGNNEPSRQFTGQIKDGTGLYFYNARYYNPTLGRFITADTVLDGLNRYTYCGNNPVRYTDPSGMSYSEAKMDDKNRGADDSPSSSSGPDMPSPGSMTYKDITIYCEKSPNSLPELPGDARNTRAPYEDGRDPDPDPGSGDCGNGSRGPYVLVDGPGQNPYYQQIDEIFFDILIRDARKININEMIQRLDKNGVYQILAGMHSIILVVYFNVDGERCFLATSLEGSGNNIDLDKAEDALTDGFSGSKYNLDMFSGLFDEKGLNDFYNRLRNDLTKVTIFIPKATEDKYDMNLVVGKIVGRWETWDEARPNYHAFDEYKGINSNTYANDIVRYSVGEENWIHIYGFPGAWGQDFEKYRPR